MRISHLMKDYILPSIDIEILVRIIDYILFLILKITYINLKIEKL